MGYKPCGPDCECLECERRYTPTNMIARLDAWTEQQHIEDAQDAAVAKLQRNEELRFLDYDTGCEVNNFRIILRPKNRDRAHFHYKVAAEALKDMMARAVR